MGLSWSGTVAMIDNNEIVPRPPIEPRLGPCLDFAPWEPLLPGSGL